jgi:hypothetical protein
MSCQKKENAPVQLNDYVLEQNYLSEYRILQLTDIHLTQTSNVSESFKILTSTINASNPDLIVISGDSFFLASAKNVRDFMDFFDSFNIPFAYIYGNHDYQGYYKHGYIQEKLLETKNALFINPPDNVYGDSNYIINLQQDNKTVWQIYLIDSNSYDFYEYTGYDYVHQDQIEWYKKEVELANNVPNVTFLHIPFPEFADAYKGYQEGIYAGFGTNLEGVYSPKYNSGFFKVLKDLGVCKAVAVGHDHINNSTINYQGVYLSYGIKSTREIYHDDSTIGGKVLILNDDKTVSFEEVFYED